MKLLPIHTPPTALVLAFLAAPSAAFAQVGAIPPQTSLRHAGTYHVETGTWSRSGPTANLGADVVYNNTCDGGSFYYPLDGQTVIDEGRLPSPTSPTSAVSRPGCASAYTIDGFEIAFCTDIAAGTTLTYQFHQSYTLCATMIGVAPTASVTFPTPGAPGGALACWIMSVDLGAQAFTMVADGDGVFTGVSNDNLFGFGVSANPPSAMTGPVAAGSTSLCGFYDGTRWDDGPAVPFWPNNLGEIGTGMGTLDMQRLEGGIPPPSCANPPFAFGSVYLRLYSDACPAPTGQAFCAGDGSGTACPCANESAPGDQEGCRNSTGRGAKLRAAGGASLANDTVVLLGSQMPPNASALFFQGTLMQNGGAGAVFGDGLRCAGGSTTRLGTITANANGLGSYPRSTAQQNVSIQGGIAAPGVRTYQVWHRNAATFCTPAVFNLSNGLSLTWGA